MEDIKKRNLTVRLSRLTQQEASTYTSTSSTCSNRPNKSKQIDLSRLAHVHRAAIAKKRKKRALANSGGGFKSSAGHVKIKMNFFKKRPPRVIEIPEIKTEIKTSGGPSSSLPTKVAPVTIVKVATEGDTSEVKESSSSETKALEPGNSSSSEDDNEEKDDSSWADEYEYRPRRAAAAAALEAVQGKKKTENNNGDSDLSKFRLRSKFPMKQTLPRAKGRSRRTFWKRAAAQKIQQYRHKPRVTTCKSLFHNNVYFQRGDIVSIIGDDEETYFCQIGGLLVDQLHRSCASLSWLVPKENAPRHPFVPHNYTIRDELQPMITEMEDVVFVMHCPHDYFYDHDINFTKLNPDGPTVYCRFGDPLVTVEDVPIVKNAPDEGQGQGTDDTSAAEAVAS